MVGLRSLQKRRVKKNVRSKRVRTQRLRRGRSNMRKKNTLRRKSKRFTKKRFTKGGARRRGQRRRPLSQTDDDSLALSLPPNPQFDEPVNEPVNEPDPSPDSAPQPTSGTQQTLRTMAMDERDEPGLGPLPGVRDEPPRPGWTNPTRRGTRRNPGFRRRHGSPTS